MKITYLLIAFITISTMVLTACEKTEIELTTITDPRQGVCSNYGLGKVSELSPYKNLVWYDEFADDYENHLPPGTDQNCYTRKPTCIRRMDWNSPGDCLENDYASIAKLNKCVWNVGEGYNFWTDNSTTSFSPNQVEVSGGHLRVSIKKNTSSNIQCGLNPTADPNSGDKWYLNCPIKMGAVNSTKFDAWGYKTPGYNAGEGRIEFRAKIRVVPTSWPALWMWEQNGRHRMTEVDIMETAPEIGETFINPFQTLHTWVGNPIPPEQSHYTSGSTHTAHFGEEYHIYGAERHGNFIKFYIDDCYTRIIHNGDPDSRLQAGTLNVDTAPMFLIIGSGITKSSINIIDQIQGENMAVDWVHVYE